MLETAIKVGGSLLGGLLSDRSSRKSQKRSDALQLASAEKDRALQREFAQKGIQWRVQDAREAGLHPLYAIGAAGAQASPVSWIPGQSRSGSHMGDAIADAAHTLGGAIGSRKQRQMADRLAEINLEKAELELAKIKKSALGQPGLQGATATPTPPRLGPKPQGPLAERPYDRQPGINRLARTLVEMPDGTVREKWDPDTYGEAADMMNLYDEAVWWTANKLLDRALAKDARKKKETRRHREYSHHLEGVAP